MARQLGPSAEGWLGGTYGVTDDGQFVAVVRFESREAATANSARPEQGEWWQKMQECFEGEVTFHDCEDVTMFLGGGSDDAGFVQVIQGKLTDPERFRTFMSQPMDALHEARPEILGGTIAIEADGTFTQTVAFTTEAAAREGEAKEMPAEMQRRRGRVLGDAGRHLPRPAPPVVRLEGRSRNGLRTRAETLLEGVQRGRLSAAGAPSGGSPPIPRPSARRTHAAARPSTASPPTPRQRPSAP